jgi:allantoicase
MLMAGFTELVDLAAARLGGVALLANDEFFAAKENLLRPEKPIWIADKYTDRGKWMDGWESRRRRTPGHDWCLIRLGIPGVIRGIVVDTSFFTGNFPSHCSLDACAAPENAAADALASSDTWWSEVLAKSELRGDTENLFEVADPRRFTHVRLNIIPDGGVARLRVHGEPVPDWRAILEQGDVVNVSAVERGGRAVDCSDRFYSHPQNLLMPYGAANMGDGWETKRRRGPGHDWAILRLGIDAVIRRVEVDTTHFKGNYPDSCSLDVARIAGEPTAETGWTEIVAPMKLGPDATHTFDVGRSVPATHVRLHMYPDGGISRLRVFGTPTREGQLREGLRALNAMDGAALRQALTNCCGSSAWVDRMTAARPFEDLGDLWTKSEAIWRALRREDWLEAFAHHPRIGDRARAPAQSPEAHRWSVQEGHSATQTPQTNTEEHGKVLAALAEANRAYEDRFGYLFIVCATGRTTEEMLAMLRERLRSDPDVELATAAGEQAKITRLRLEKLLTGA